ncbi:MAG: cytochrome C [Candidatus Omnitrophica bacterium]|nr:cytochrome C [Candidatus Omnitrophota bacterium]
MTDANFREIVLKPDNVPIVAMIYLIAFFTWFSLRRAVENDEAITKGGSTFEGKESDQKLYTWPNLIYQEFICSILVGVVLLIWSILLKAPLEEPADPSISPNPSKAPWYFLGLQEMLVYFDPWLAGVVFPTLILFGLMAIPYIDKNPKGNGYFTFVERRFAITLFLYGWLIMWVLLIIMGTFLRGPNWNFFGPYEKWSVHKVVPLVNVNLSEFVYVKWLNTGLPKHWFLREIFGIVATVLYFAVTPFILAKTVLKRMYIQLGIFRYAILMILLLPMIGLLLKMLLRWSFNLKYIIAIPEYFLNV